MTTINRIRPIEGEKPRILRSYCVSVFLPKPDPNSVYRKEATPDDFRRHSEQCLPVSRAVNAILDVPGVTVVRIFDYELQITIAPAYDWSDCHEEIVSAIKTHLFPGIDNVDVVDVQNLRGMPGRKPRERRRDLAF
jgi:hypothetical protein